MSARAATVFGPMPDRPRFQAPERGASAPAWRGAAACLLVTVVALVTALIATNAAGVPLRDPSHVTEGRLTKALLLVAVLIARRLRDPRARALAGRAAGDDGRRRARFYVTYFAYRNLKSIVPLLRPTSCSTAGSGTSTAACSAGRDPAQVLHDLLGTGVSAEVLSVVYGCSSCSCRCRSRWRSWSRATRAPGCSSSPRSSLNWVLAAGSYFLLPSLGPVYARAGELRGSAVHRTSATCRRRCSNQRTDFLHDPAAAGAAQSIGAFASLHVSIFFTAALATLLLGAPPARVRGGLGAVRPDRRWPRSTSAGTTCSTTSPAWLIAVTSLALARALTGFELRAARRRVPAPSPRPHDAARRTPPRARARGLARGGAADLARGAGRPDRGRGHAARRRSGPHSGRTCRCATPTTSPRSTSCWSACGVVAARRARHRDPRRPPAPVARGDARVAPRALDARRAASRSAAASSASTSATWPTAT